MVSGILGARLTRLRWLLRNRRWLWWSWSHRFVPSMFGRLGLWPAGQWWQGARDLQIHGQVRRMNSNGLCALFFLWRVAGSIFETSVHSNYVVVCHGQKLPGLPAEGDLFRPRSSALEAAWLASVRPSFGMQHQRILKRWVPRCLSFELLSKLHISAALISFLSRSSSTAP